MLPSTDPVFVTLQTVGADPHEDGAYFVEAAGFPVDEGKSSVIPATWMHPYPNLDRNAPLSRRLADFGLTQKKLAPLPAAADTLPALFSSLAARPVVLFNGRREFLARFALACPDAVTPVVLDLEAFATFLHPSRSCRTWQDSFQKWVKKIPPTQPTVDHIRQLCEALVRAHFDRPTASRELVARSMEEMQVSTESTADAWEWLELARRLLDHPSRFGAAEEDLFFAPIDDGGFSDDLEQAPIEADRLIADLRPRFAEDYQMFFAEYEPLESRLEEESGLLAEDAQYLENSYDLLPKLFAREGETAQERPGQRVLANAISDMFAGSQFLIADAPTGTGKTLAYLIPLLLWGRRHSIRVGLSTYTRALQEQAYFREVPRALELLRQAGVPPQELPRVSLLKGRSHYICGRAIRDSAPELGSGSLVARATWMRLALFYHEDPTTDLDGFSADPGLPCGNSQRTLRTASAVMQQVRALPRCCHGRAAKRCGAGIRTLRAERSHLVVTNHAFVLARPEFFSHILFDECDHLHDVALSARSFDIDLHEVGELSKKLLSSRGRDRAPLERLQRLLEKLPAGDRSEDLLQQAQTAKEGAQKLDAAAHECTRELKHFQTWRNEKTGTCTAEERAFLLHEYLEIGVGDGLATALHYLRQVIDTTDSALRCCIEELGDLTYKTARQLRWSLRRPLEELAHWREGLDQWLHDEGSEEEGLSHDLLGLVEFGNRRPLLILKCLLPQKWLGETYIPSLRNAGFISATAQLRGGFKAMKGYLGLDIAEEESLDRPGREVQEFVGPPTFDPKAALVAIPEDAPAYAHTGGDHEIWMDYLEDCFVYLTERTRGRTLGLFTNQKVLQRVGQRMAPRFQALGIPFYWQGMPGFRKEDLLRRFHAQTDSVLFGVDTFWYGVDFPGETCEHVVITKLPFAALDDYHFGQTARMGFGPQKNRIYLPRALAMFRQGCGRLIRQESDRGSILILDRRVLEKRHADFLKELPGGLNEWEGPNLLKSDSDTCFQKIFAHMKLGKELERRGLDQSFSHARRKVSTEPF